MVTVRSTVVISIIAHLAYWLITARSIGLQKVSLIYRPNLWTTFFNTLADDKKYPVLNRDNLMIPIQMQLSKTQKKFCDFFPAFLTSTLNFKHFEQKDDTHRFCNFEITSSGNVVREMSKKSRLRHLHKHCWNLQDSIFIKLIDHFAGNWTGERLSYWHTKCWDSLLTQWLQMKSILFLIKTI